MLYCMGRAGFSLRKAALVLYLAGDEEVEELYARLGKHSRGKACLYIKKLEDVDLAVLARLVALSWEATGVRYG